MNNRSAGPDVVLELLLNRFMYGYSAGDFRATYEYVCTRAVSESRESVTLTSEKSEKVKSLCLSN
jgi:hypothetical protein